MKEKLFNKGFILITLINFVVYLVYYLLMVIIAVIAQEELNASLGEAGFASGIYIIGTLLARLYMGKKLELFGRKRVLRFGILFFLVTTLAYLYMPTIAIMFIIRFLNGFAYGTTSTATNAIVTAYIPNSRNGEGINYYGLSTSLAAAIGPFIGMILLSKTNFYTIIIFSTVIVFLTALLCFYLPVKNIVLTTEHRKALQTWTVKSFIETKVIPITFIAFLMGISYSSVLTFLASYAREINLVSAGTFFFVVYALVITFTRPMSGKLFDAKGEKYVMYPSYLFLAVGLVVLSTATSSLVLLISGGLIGLGYGTFMSNGQAVCLKVCEPHRIGIGLSTYFIGLDLGLGIGPYIMGEIHHVLSFQGIYIIAGAIAFVCVFIYMFLSRKKVSSGAQEQLKGSEEL
ncbi:MFS transporter [Listeria cossartiae subsp. cayugensis]|uniref:MFS transporter n=1 Tax=Listeria cossartiae TaxID=2838249 RepID=UPI002880B5BE|nr:MFS transporter [Listeria cossartiae]MDT0002869.1 MFS transporter [Listeria cossartiae subsp. cayugensis]MDT0018763.1 MFS transporter [Listeria cossartiae subsp. cayugensis]MDT0035664.1 MFS transporter [Listeria cossartiae subsp. cayugensis]MDT0040513.1 MFS transporter [Listeria cossartiae subsp. cayugensis]MDT0046366.1 MFS transporter [Listeria cossartiae subsp. cayugensis]